MTGRLARGFVAKHPLFKKQETKTGIWWEKSPYYLWWEYLRLHEGYRETCLNGGDGAYRALYEDFGNVHSLDFKEWWQSRGVDLFSEPMSTTKVMALSDEEVKQLLDYPRDDRVLLVAIPIHYPKRTIARSLRKILKENQSRKRGEKLVKFSRAKYPLLFSPDTYALSITLKCYKLKLAEPDLPYWQIAQRCNVSGALSQSELEGTGGHVADKKASMTAGVSRKLKHAATLIEGVGKGIFPLR